MKKLAIEAVSTLMIVLSLKLAFACREKGDSLEGFGMILSFVLFLQIHKHSDSISKL